MRFFPNFRQIPAIDPPDHFSRLPRSPCSQWPSPSPFGLTMITIMPIKHLRRLTLSAMGSVNTKPDMATINTGIETEAVSAGDALEDNSDIMARMLKSLKAAGLANRDIATTQFSVQPRYQRFKNGRPAKVIGYRVTNSVRITVRELDDLGSILDRLVTIGSNRMNGIQFGLSEPGNTLDEARKDAMRKVLDKASLYANAANVTLGSILSISEQASRRSPRPMANAHHASERPSTDSAGSTHVAGDCACKMGFAGMS